MSPDLATVIPTTANGGITDGGKTVTVHIQQGVHFSPPVNREVTSADVAYAIERGANPNVGNAYFGRRTSARARRRRWSARQAPTTRAARSRDPDAEQVHDRVPHDQAVGSFLVAGAQPADLGAGARELRGADGQARRRRPTARKYLVATGPYMIKADPKTGMFQGIGYQTGKSLTLVRNPNWNAEDRLPARRT